VKFDVVMLGSHPPNRTISELIIADERGDVSDLIVTACSLIYFAGDIRSALCNPRVLVDCQSMLMMLQSMLMMLQSMPMMLQSMLMMLQSMLMMLCRGTPAQARETQHYIYIYHFDQSCLCG
jgi:hypothetical protein